MSKEIRLKQRFVNFEKSFQALERTVAIENPSEAERGGLIQFFEVTFELSWKTLKDSFEADRFQVSSPREVLKQAFQSGLIKDRHTWIEALDDLDLVALLIYEEEIARNLEQLIREKYYPTMSNLIITLKNKQNSLLNWRSPGLCARADSVRPSNIKNIYGGRRFVGVLSTLKAPTKRRPPVALFSSRLCILTVLMLPLLGCQPESSRVLPKFDGQRAFHEVEALVEISPRDAGTPEGWKAADHILERLVSFGVEAEIDTFVDMTPGGEKTMRNVVGQIPGKSGRWIILGSHFDTMPGIDNFQGANDSGSSTGVLLELARQLSEVNCVLEVGLLFAFFDGEEGIAGYGPNDGLHGSRRLATQLVLAGRKESIKAMVLLDMVGDKDLHFVVPHNSSHNLVKEVLDAAHATGHRDLFSLSHGAIITDDHVPFLDVGIPAIDIIDFRYGSAPGLNDYWHTEADCLENISPESLEIVGEIVLQLLKQMAFPANAD